MSKIPAGYKQTEVGVIPEEWETFPLADVVQFLDGLRRPVKDSDRIKMQGDIPYYGASGIVDYVNKHLFDEELILLGEDGENIVSRNLRLAFIVRGKTWVNNHAHVLRPRQNANIGYLCEFLESLNYEEYNSGTAQPKINQQTCAKIPVVLPPLSEQKRIAQVLGDVDTLIQKLEALIAKMRDIKQAAMQELLTGKRRLPGFSGPWETKKLVDVFYITTGKSKSAYITFGGDFIVCDMGSVSIEGRIVASKRTNYRGDFLKKGDLVMPKDDIGGGKIIGRVGYIDYAERYVLSDHVYRLSAIDGDPLFFAYLINSHSINIALGKKVIGSAQLGLGRRSVEEQEILFPPLLEQSAIAQVLSDIDNELAQLETRLGKTRNLKAGLMQQLLTGKIRLGAKAS